MNREYAQKINAKRGYYSKGKRGLIYTANYDGKKYAIKIKNDESKAPNTIRREYENNLILNKIGIGPKVFYYDEEEDFVVREFVDGEEFFEWVDDAKKDEIKKFFEELLMQCYKMDDIKLNKLEMNHPHKDLLVQDNKPIIIDFERCKVTMKPKNVTQVAQFITSKSVKEKIECKNIIFNRDKILELAEEYKKNEDKREKTFQEIIKIIKKS